MRGGAELELLKSLGNATSEDILEGKTAVVQGELVTGTLTNKTTVSTSSPVDMKQYIERWAELTTVDFKVGVTQVNAAITGTGTVTVGRIGCNAYPSYSYNSSTGVLTFANGSCSATESESPPDNYVQGSTSGVFAIYLGTVAKQ